jgi:hypothetical protein
MVMTTMMMMMRRKRKVGEQGRFGVTENRVPLGLMNVTAMRQLKLDHAVTVNVTKLKICPKIQR